VLGHTDANITLKVYARVFDKPDLASGIRAAQSAVLNPVVRLRFAAIPEPES
jgi:hypothetical protein